MGCPIGPRMNCLVLWPIESADEVADEGEEAQERARHQVCACAEQADGSPG
jgi:hypothetical protein